MKTLIYVLVGIFAGVASAADQSIDQILAAMNAPGGLVGNYHLVGKSGRGADGECDQQIQVQASWLSPENGRPFPAVWTGHRMVDFGSLDKTTIGADRQGGFDVVTPRASATFATSIDHEFSILGGFKSGYAFKLNGNGDGEVLSIRSVEKGNFSHLNAICKYKRD